MKTTEKYGIIKTSLIGLIIISILFLLVWLIENVVWVEYAFVVIISLLGLFLTSFALGHFLLSDHDDYDDGGFPNS